MRYPPRDLAELLKQESHRICAMILGGDYEEIDIAIEIDRLREYCERVAPDKSELFEAVYVGRFRRLWEQFREDR